MRQHLIELVGFAQDMLVKQHCPFCDAKFSKTDVMAQGNRRGTDGKSYYYYETHCSECGQPSMAIITTRPMDTRGLMETLVEHYAGRERESPNEADSNDAPKPKPSATGISDAEVEQAKAMLDRARTGEDVMRGLGMNDEIIKRYMREGGEKDADGDTKS